MRLRGGAKKKRRKKKVFDIEEGKEIPECPLGIAHRTMESYEKCERKQQKDREKEAKQKQFAEDFKKKQEAKRKKEKERKRAQKKRKKQREREEKESTGREEKRPEGKYDGEPSTTHVWEMEANSPPVPIEAVIHKIPQKMQDQAIQNARIADALIRQQQKPHKVAKPKKKIPPMPTAKPPKTPDELGKELKEKIRKKTTPKELRKRARAMMLRKDPTEVYNQLQFPDKHYIKSIRRGKTMGGVRQVGNLRRRDRTITKTDEKAIISYLRRNEKQRTDLGISLDDLRAKSLRKKDPLDFLGLTDNEKLLLRQKMLKEKEKNKEGSAMKKRRKRRKR
jgi:hypothetical protein